MSKLQKTAIAAIVAAATAFTAACTTVTETSGGQQFGGASPASSEADARKRASIRVQLAADYYQKGQFNVALEEAKRALQAEPSNAGALGLLGLIYMELGDREQAEANFQKAMRLEPDNPDLQNNYGWFLCQGGREREALGWFQRAADNKQYTTPSLPMQNAGLCMLRVRDNKSAEEFLRRSFELDAANNAVKFQLARLYLSERQLERARFYYGLLPQGMEAGSDLLWLGMKLARAEGNPRAERQLADDLRRRFPSSPEASLLRRGAFDE